MSDVAVYRKGFQTAGVAAIEIETGGRRGGATQGGRRGGAAPDSRFKPRRRDRPRSSRHPDFVVIGIQ